MPCLHIKWHRWAVRVALKTRYLTMCWPVLGITMHYLLWFELFLKYHRGVFAFCLTCQHLDCVNLSPLNSYLSKRRFLPFTGSGTLGGAFWAPQSRFSLGLLASSFTAAVPWQCVFTPCPFQPSLHIGLKRNCKMSSFEDVIQNNIYI